jgi:tetratricopeptide (TPR) repeat protein
MTSNYQAASQANNYFELGNQAYGRGNREEAKQFYLKCLQLAPNFIHAQYNLGVVCTELEQWQEASFYLRQAIATKPDHAHAYNYLGIVARRQNRLSEAILYFKKAIALHYQFPYAHHNLGMALLQTGDYETGFAECEWRWQTPKFTPISCPYPQWQGEDIRQRNILIHTEQGAGDAIQFIRFVPFVAQLCQQVILCCPDNLVNLFRNVAGVDTIYTAGAIPLSQFSTYAPLMSLPYL